MLTERNSFEIFLSSRLTASDDSSRQVSTRTGIEHEETLLYESAARETSLNTQIVEFEIENKQIKAELERLKNEKLSAINELTKVQKSSQLLEQEMKTIKTEMKEYRFRETRLLTDYSELEEENVALQKQVEYIFSVN